MSVYKMRGMSLCFLVFVAVLLAGCIKPNSNQPATATPGGPLIQATQPAGSGVVSNPTVPSAAGTADPTVQQFILGRGQAPNGLQVWYNSPLGPDRLQGFSYSDVNGLPCAGFLLTSFANNVWTPTNGALICAPQAGTPAIAGVTFIATTDGAFYTIAFGRVDNPSVTAVAVVYSDGTNQPTNPILGGYLVIKSGTVGVNTITAVDVQGNTVIPNIPQLPV